MEQAFLDVFNTLSLKESLKTLFEDVYILKMVSVTKKNLVKIFIKSNHIIPRKEKADMERIIKKDLFSGEDIDIKIVETYELPSVYTVTALLNEYKESMLYDLTENSPILKNCFIKIRFEEIDKNTVTVIVPEKSIFKERENEIVDYLKHITTDRFNMEAVFKVVYEKPEGEEEREKEREALTEYKVQKLIRSDLVASMEESESESKDENAPEDKASEKKETAKPAPSVPRSVSKQNFSKSYPSKKSFTPRNSMPEESDNPDVLYGREIDPEEEPINLCDLVEDFLPVVVTGEIIKVEDRRDIRNNKAIFGMHITDYTDTVKVKLFCKSEDYDTYAGKFKKGTWVKVKGIPQLDTFEHEVNITSPQGIMKGKSNRTKRMDLSPEKRVELHCHTKMSDMDGVSEVTDIINCAYSWGHKAIAVTDHGVVQAFTDANHAWEKLWGKEKDRCKEAGEKPDRQNFFKVIYGVEGYLVDDLTEAVYDSKGQSLDGTFVVFDIETTGFSPIKNKIIEIGAVKIKDGEIVDRFSEFVNPECPIPYRISKLTSITDEDVKDALTIEEVLPEFTAFCMGSVLVAHNAGFDTSFIKENCKRLGLPYDYTAVDTLTVSRAFLQGLHNYKLDTVAKELGVSLKNHHRAVDDAECTAGIFIKLLKMAEEKGITDLDKLEENSKLSKDSIRSMMSHHVIILAKNNTGRINLYTLVSKSHLEYFGSNRNKVPKIPKSEILKYREGLIIGSACEAGELYQALVEERGDDTIAKIVNFYDYLEIQPVGNNEFMIRDTVHEKYERFNTIEDLREINREIVRLGEMYNKPVVATCDVHFLNPEDELYRRIIMKGQGFEDADNQAPLYLHTTDEMLEEFGYLGLDKAKEVVITNPNMIADSIDSISPVRPDKCAPVIENSDELLKNICYTKAHEMYGPELPEIVSERLERELNSIIKNGFAVMYIIAQKLVWKSVEDGYLVGSRGSVGSSFVATMAGITEVNPLVPHYYCSNCHYNDFDSEDVKKFRGMAGVDMPDKACPVCGANLKKDGFDIPFETFLGFKGDKEPDIDLNFSGEYQSKAHRYTEVIFGAGQTFRAGTIATLADKTAFGYVKKYFEEAGIKKRVCEIDRIVSGCVGVRRSTGQHPGGIIVLPVGEDINSFTPVQHPANDQTTDTVTTHFDYHSID
ncbi:MAG: PolC-type DNA polymerase III, partial [Lachnospiraceae bacterium]|nr:PolC-type DNA polymerase III [Lachnospiraceae bacterium]